MPDVYRSKSSSGGCVIVTSDDIGHETQSPLLAIVFAAGHRPDAAAIDTLSAANGQGIVFSVSHRPRPDQGWVELLAQGMTFDCTGLAPRDPVASPPAGTLLGLAEAPAGEAIGLAPGPHLAHGHGLLPVARVLTAVGARMAQMSGASAVCWLPAGTWMAPDYFVSRAVAWLHGGAFPALGLTSLYEDAFGATLSRGLSWLIGQELRFEPGHGLDRQRIGKIAIRLIHDLVESGPLAQEQTVTGPDAEQLLIVPIRDGSLIRVMVLPN